MQAKRQHRVLTWYLLIGIWLWLPFFYFTEPDGVLHRHFEDTAGWPNIPVHGRQIPSQVIAATHGVSGGKNALFVVHLPPLQVPSRVRWRAALHALLRHQTSNRQRTCRHGQPRSEVTVFTRGDYFLLGFLSKAALTFFGIPLLLMFYTKGVCFAFSYGPTTIRPD